MSREAELIVKRQRVEAFLDRHNLHGLLLGRNSSVSWALAGAEAHVALNSETAGAAVLYTREQAYVLADGVEMPRLLAEEQVREHGFEPVLFPWYEPQKRDQLVHELASGGPVAADIAAMGCTLLQEPIAALRYQLLPEEQARLRTLSERAGAAIETAIGEIAPGMSEHAIAGLLAEECFLRDITPVVLLVATDERVHRFRHPLPSCKTLGRYAMLVLCARRWGLITNVTRLVHFGVLPDDLRARSLACARVDAATIAATRPGAAMRTLFSTIQAAYTAEGFAEEWRDHHQGGAAGYENREWFATPSGDAVVEAGQAFAWNPSIAGVKSEDTILVQEHGWEILTATARWPKLVVPAGERSLERPAILEVE